MYSSMILGLQAHKAAFSEQPGSVAQDQQWVCKLVLSDKHFWLYKGNIFRLLWKKPWLSLTCLSIFFPLDFWPFLYYIYSKHKGVGSILKYR